MKAVHAGDIGGVIHCYSYTKELAREFLNMDYYFGIGGVLTFTNAKKLKEAVAYIPMEKLVLETDCPYLTPESLEGYNTPKNLPLIAGMVAELKGVDIIYVKEKTAHNAKKLFGL